MRSYTIELDWGDYVDYLIAAHCVEAGIDRSTLFRAVGHVTGDHSRTTISKLLGSEHAPLDPKDRNRAVVLVLALGLTPEDVELSLDDLSAPLSALGPKRIRSLVRSQYAPRDSNPEPADIAPFVALDTEFAQVHDAA